MNDVYLSGSISGAPVLKMERENTPHLLFCVTVTHRAKNGRLYHETYRVSAWNNTALRAYETLKPGQFVMVHAYLVQRLSKADGIEYIHTELTAKSFTASFRSIPGDDYGNMNPDAEEQDDTDCIRDEGA